MILGGSRKGGQTEPKSMGLPRPEGELAAGALTEKIVRPLFRRLFKQVLRSLLVRSSRSAGQPSCSVDLVKGAVAKTC
jgi:hypothetical protein